MKPFPMIDSTETMLFENTGSQGRSPSTSSVFSIQVGGRASPRAAFGVLSSAPVIMHAIFQSLDRVLHASPAQQTAHSRIGENRCNPHSSRMRHYGVARLWTTLLHDGVMIVDANHGMSNYGTVYEHGLHPHVEFQSNNTTEGRIGVNYLKCCIHESFGEPQ